MNESIKELAISWALSISVGLLMLSPVLFMFDNFNKIEQRAKTKLAQNTMACLKLESPTDSEYIKCLKLLNKLKRLKD